MFSASSPAEALEPRASSSCCSLTCGQRGRFGRMDGAGGRRGGPAERGKVGSGRLARPLVTQLFSPQGGWEQPQQQAEAKPIEMRTGLPLGGNQPRARTEQCQALGLGDGMRAPGLRGAWVLSRTEAWPRHAHGRWEASSKAKFRAAGGHRPQTR